MALLFSQLNDVYIFQQHRTGPHWHLDVRRFRNEVLFRRWIGRSGPHDLTLYSWPPLVTGSYAVRLFILGVSEG